MGFWDFLKGKQQAKRLELSLDEVEAFVEKSLSNKRKELDELVAKKFSEIKYVLAQAKASLGELKEQPLESQNVKLKKIVGTSREQTVARLSALLERLQPPSSSELEQVRQYCIEGSALLQKEIEHVGKNIAYTGIYLKESIKQLGQNIKELSGQFSFLKKTVQEFSAVFLQKPVKESLNAIREKSRVVALVEENITKGKLLLAKKEQEVKRLVSSLQELESSPAFKEIGALQEERGNLLKEKQTQKTELFSLLSTIDKPLKRFSKAVASGRIILPASLRPALEQLQQNPLQLLKKDPKGESVKDLLLELKKAIEEQLIELKEKEREKRLSALEELLAFDFFSKVFWKFNEIDSKLQAIERGLREKAVAVEISSIEEKIKDCEKSIQELGFSLEALNAKLEREREELSSLRQKVEELLQEIVSAPVSLK